MLNQLPTNIDASRYTAVSAVQQMRPVQDLVAESAMLPPNLQIWCIPLGNGTWGLRQDKSYFDFERKCWLVTQPTSGLDYLDAMWVAQGLAAAIQIDLASLSTHGD